MLNICTSYLSSIHPGHACLVMSFPFCTHAYRGYHHSLRNIVVPKELLLHATTTTPPSPAEDALRRSFGISVATRALSVATHASIGGLSLTLAAAFYMTGCTTLPQALDATKEWAHGGRRHIDRWLGVADRMDMHHPEVKEMNRLSEDEQLEVLFPSSDYMDNEHGKENEA